MKRVTRSFIALSVAAVLVLAGSTIGATAATKPTVSIAKISNAKVAKGKTVTIKPRGKASSSDVKILSQRLTATKKGFTAANRSSIKLKAGTYKVTQTVKYQVKETKSVTLDQYEVAFAECTVGKIVEEDVIEARLVVTCTSRDFPGTQKLTVDLEWNLCGWEEYLDYECSASEYLDDYSWWEGTTSNGQLSFETWGDNADLYPEVGEKFDALIQVMGDPWTVTGKVWSKTKVKTLTQSLKVTTKK